VKEREKLERKKCFVEVLGGNRPSLCLQKENIRICDYNNNNNNIFKRKKMKNKLEGPLYLTFECGEEAKGVIFWMVKLKKKNGQIYSL